MYKYAIVPDAIAQSRFNISGMFAPTQDSNNHDSTQTLISTNV